MTCPAAHSRSGQENARDPPSRETCHLSNETKSTLRSTWRICRGAALRVSWQTERGRPAVCFVHADAVCLSPWITASIIAWQWSWDRGTGLCGSTYLAAKPAVIRVRLSNTIS
ncbi:hypothetical protein K402DRAFT_12845 [Aulographum hederae CBS 113979]|uniref:Uncharacterized protein n=1 Tax=Aulographum hederae CBS 113979 TaxID=1176131 RepID=A0A6G1H7I5_9PEZI|nr:hypothetical protein K402DRAFT_12845 [Aulographum hederae CBS 113979]